MWVVLWVIVTIWTLFTSTSVFFNLRIGNKNLYQTFELYIRLVEEIVFQSANSTLDRKMFLSKIIVIIVTLFSIAFTCHTNKGKLDNVNSGMLCDFVNVTEHESFSRHPTKKKYIYLNASKSNIGVLPCYRGDLVNNQLSYFSTPVSDSDLLNQVNNSASIVNSPFECQSICQYWEEWPSPTNTP